MDHDTIERTRAVERYLLDEMSGPERDEFEEHYFCCAECAGEVRAGAEFQANVRTEAVETVAPRTPAPTKARSQFGWLRSTWAPALAGMLVVLAGYQQFVALPRARQTAVTWNQIQAPRRVLAPDLRGGAFVPLEYTPGTPFLIRLDIPPSFSPGPYTARIDRESGESVATAPVSIGEGDVSVDLAAPSQALAPGNYVIQLVPGTSAVQSAAVARYRVELKAK